MPIDAAAVKWDPEPVADGAPPTDSPETAPPAIDSSAVKWDAGSPPDPRNQSAQDLAHSGINIDKGSSIGKMLYPEVDFDAGLPFLDRTHLAQADNFSEKKLYLQNVYGKKNVETDTDPFGEPMLVVVQNGKKIAAEGGGGFENFGANVVGSGPEWLGAGIGGALGSVEPGAGTLAGAGLGAGIGKEATQVQKKAEGWYSQTNQEAVGNALTAVEGGAVGEEGGQVASRLASRFLRGRLPSIVSGTNPETNAMTDNLLAGGARPPVASTMPDAKRLQFMESLGAKTVGVNKAQADANTAFIRKRVRGLLGDSGLSDEQVDAVAKQLEEGDSALPTAEVGQHVKDRVIAHRKMLEDNTRTQLGVAQETLDNTMKHLDTLVGRYRTGDLGVDAASAISSARQDFGTAMSKVYSRVDQLAGNRKLVNTDVPAQEAQRMGRRLPKSGQQPLTKETAAMGQQGAPPTGDDVALYQSLGLEPPPADMSMVSFSDAQRMRSSLRAKADELSLTRNPKSGEAARMADMWDYAIQSAAKDPAAAPAVKMLNAADKAYGQGIRRFKDTTVQRLVNDMKAGLPPDPETVAATIVQPGQEARVKEVRKLVGEPVWKRVAGADYARMMNASTDENGQVSGQRMLKEIRTRGKLMEQVYGDKQSSEITEFAKSLAARDGKLDPRLLAPGQLKKTIEMYRGAQAQEDRFMKESALGQLSNPKQNPEQAYRWLVRPSNSAGLSQAVKLFGENSPQMEGLRKAALQEVLTQAKFSVSDGRASDALTQALKKYTPEQQKLLFPKGMDSDLHLLGHEVSAVMKDLGDESKASFAAGAVLGSPALVRYPMQVGIGIYNTILSQPKVIRYLALGLRSESGPARIAARHMVESLVRYGAISPTVRSDAGAPHDGENDSQPGAEPGTQQLAEIP